ncbi:hypothetical protein JCM8097_007760 [Rhodosporidiobolus ruineniae]
MAALPSTAGLDLDLARLSLSSPYSAAPAPAPPVRHHTPGSASSSLDRSSNPASAQPQVAHGLQPHQIMQPPVHSGPPPHVQLQEPQRRRGVVKFFNSLKGFGFVVDNDPDALGGQEVFCHFSAISGKGGFRSLAEGEEVEYELVQGPKGFQAANLTGPGGRTVVGDPKARMQKPPAYPMFAPIPLPMGGPYLADPYHAQHGAVYAGSPYTSHVLYVPATAVPPSQYAYAPVPLAAAPPPPARGGPSPSASAGAPSGSASPFAAPQYQSFGAATTAGAISGPPVPGAGADRFSSLTRIGAATGAYGAPAEGLNGAGARTNGLGAGYASLGAPSPAASNGHHVQQNGRSHAHGANPAFSPPGGGASQYAGLPPASPPLGNGAPAFGGFAPFSPPSSYNPQLFAAPPAASNGVGAGGYYAVPAQQPQHHQQQSQHQSQPSLGATPSALFGSLPASIGSRSNTPAGGRSTPALGNGSLGSDAWRTTGSPAGSAVL